MWAYVMYFASRISYDVFYVEGPNKEEVDKTASVPYSEKQVDVQSSVEETSQNWFDCKPGITPSTLLCTQQEKIHRKKI